MTVAHTWSSESQERNKNVSLWGWGVTIEVMVVSGKVMQGKWRLSQAKHGATYLEFQHLKRWSRRISWFPRSAYSGQHCQFKASLHYSNTLLQNQNPPSSPTTIYKMVVLFIWNMGWIWNVCHKDKCLIYWSPIDCTVLESYWKTVSWWKKRVAEDRLVDYSLPGSSNRISLLLCEF